MIGLAAELRGDKLVKNVLRAVIVWVFGMKLYTCSNEKTTYGLEQQMKTIGLERIELNQKENSSNFCYACTLIHF